MKEERERGHETRTQGNSGPALQMFAAMKKAAEAMMQQNVTVRKGILWPKRGTDWAIGQL